MQSPSGNKIHVQNIYYLLCYAWNKLEEKEIANVKEDGITNLLDLFASVLINGTSRVLHKGLDRSYREVEEKVNGIRGKLDVSYTIKSGLLYKSQTYCRFDEFDHNVLHNQILKATIAKLLQVDTLDSNLKKKLYLLFRKFQTIDSIKVDRKMFSRIQLHQNNYFYDFLLKICGIIHENIFFNQEDGSWKFREFDQDEIKMRHLFQAFVRRFYQEELGCSMRPSRIEWQLTPVTEEAKRYLPKMVTDITMDFNGRNIIVDTKYYKKTLYFNGKKKSIYSNHLYQLFAYIKNIEARDQLECIEGILLYPVVTDNYRFEYKTAFGNHKMSVHTINLNQHHTLISNDLKKIIQME